MVFVRGQNSSYTRHENDYYLRLVNYLADASAYLTEFM